MNQEVIELLNSGRVPIADEGYYHDLYDIFKNKSKGRFQIKRKTVPIGTEQMHYDRKTGMCRGVFVEEFKSVQLTEKGTFSNIWMSDVPFEQETNKEAIDDAFGDVLECGLGLGYFTYFASKKRKVDTVTIVEKEQDIIDLVYDKIKNRKTRIIHDDAIHFLKTTNELFDTIHLDIWASVLPYNEFDSLHRIARKKLKPNGEIITWLDGVFFKIKQNLKSGARSTVGFGVFPPCPTCGKMFRYDFGGFCMDCADGLGISEIFLNKKQRKKQ